MTAPQAAESRLRLLLRIEGEIRQLPSWAATAAHALNATEELLGQTQGFFFLSNKRKHLRCQGVMAAAQVNSRAPLVLALECAVNRLADASTPQDVDLIAALRQPNFPHPFGFWLPLVDGRGKLLGGLLLNRDDAWTDDICRLAIRLSGAYAHAFRAQQSLKPLRRHLLMGWTMWVAPFAIAALALVPVPRVTMATFEVVPRDPMPVTVGIEGVVSEVAVLPNQPVRAGQLLFLLDQTTVLADRETANLHMQIAQTRLETARNDAFANEENSQSFAIMEKELELAEAELAMIESRLALTQIVAAEDGIALFSSVNDWIGRRLRAGEKLMDIANPVDVAIRADVAVHDAAALPESEAMRVFLDAAPLSPRRARIYEKSYLAAERVSGHLTYSVKALLESNAENPPRIGMRGQVQLLGGSVSLGYYFIMRPLAVLRQWAGL